MVIEVLHLHNTAIDYLKTFTKILKVRSCSFISL